MPYLRWLHKSWNAFWTFIGVLILSVTLIIGGVFGAMQLQPVKDQIALELQQRFAQNYEGVISIGSIKGLLPFNVELNDVKVYHNESSYIPVLETSQITAGIDVWSLLQNRFFVNSLQINDPESVFDPDSSFSVHNAFIPKPDTSQVTEGDPEAGFDFGLQIIIPSVIVQNGSLDLRNILDRNNSISSESSLKITDLNMDLFFEYTEEQRFIDMNSVTFNTSAEGLNDIEIYGQVYNDDQFFELNAINIRSGNSLMRFSGEADNVNILDGDIWSQFSNTGLSFSIDRLMVEPKYISRLFPKTPRLPANLNGSLTGQGSLDSLAFANGELIVGDSFSSFNGFLKNLKPSSPFSYEVNIASLILNENELRAVYSSRMDSIQVEAIAANRYQGMISGNTDTTNIQMEAEGERGSINAGGVFSWGGDQTSFDISFRTDSLNLGYLFDPRIQETDLTLRGEVKSNSFDLREANGGLFIESIESIESDESNLDNRNFNQIYVLANWQDGFIEPELRADVNGSLITTNGWVDLRKDTPELSLQGSARQIQVKEIIQNESLRPVIADIEYDLNLKGASLDELYGQVSMDVLQAIVESDTLGRHQLYFDFNEPDSPNRVLRFTSTAFDATVEGNYNPASLLTLSSQWNEYFREQISEELFFEAVSKTRDTTKIEMNQSLELTGRVKNPGMLNFYFKDLPSLASSARVSSSINVNSQQLLFNASFVDQKTNIGNFNADSLIVQVTGGFRKQASLKEFSNLQVQAEASLIDYDYLQGTGFELSANMEEDSVDFITSMERLSNEASFLLEGHAILLDEALALRIDDFELGTDTYRWVNRGTPMLRYLSNDKLVVNDFVFDNEDQFLEVNGTFSTSPEDSVNYNVIALDLQDISDLMGGRLGFGGNLDGRFTTRTLTTVPTVQGDVNIEALSLGGSLVGDLNLSSVYNSEFDRFDTNISVSTDSVKYPEYFANTDRRGQEFDIEGYVLAPKDGSFPDADSLYKFDVDFENIDLWILPLIGPKVFAEGSGMANGEGLIWGNANDYDFKADFIVGSQDAAYIRPQFLDTYYYAQGEISFTRHEGLTFKDIYLIDPSGGSSTLSGYYDFNDFAPIDSMNISLEMNEFQFLNSEFDPTLAFFGNAYGSGTVIISGTNFDPVLRTAGPIQISDFSEISIPLLEETDFNEDNRFIRFVDSFDPEDIRSTGYSSRGRIRANGDGAQEEVDLSFAERFTLDLQFQANDPMTVRLIFDPVTGDIVTAEGTGRIRILLEDEQVSMFGRFDIQGGRYQFVSGDIFTRRFELESGGTISWEGDPANASLNLNAVYSARPDINTLSNTERDPENSQRVPVDLVLNIGGTISSIENNFFFRLPDTFESQQSSTLSTQLASINRDEDLKLLQAANFMLMGNFIPVSSTGQAQTNLFSENLSGSAAVLNPLISSQVINPLLSNQVNSLLNSDLSSLDVDFNLNTYNQVDLGVALRLYNDKLILRREGQITGRQSNIGDLGATYRINRTFALTAFHRQALGFGTLSSTEQSQQSQDINGLGLEAKVSFNSWNEFFDRLFSPFRKLFGIQKKEQNQEELTENSRDRDPA